MITLKTSLSSLLKNHVFAGGKPYVYVALGDSATEGIGASSKERSFPAIIHKFLTSKHRKTEYHNLGKRQSPTNWVISDQLKEAVELNPDLITLSVGANDIRVKNMPWKFEKNLRFILKTLKANTDATIVINSIPNFTHTSWVPVYLKPVVALAIKRFNQIIEKVAKEENILFVDLYDQTLLYARTYPEAMASDNFHPSDFGYALWANSILHSLKMSTK